MPLVDLSAEQAVASRKSNPNVGWGERSGVNRVEPIAAPAFDTPFRLERGEPIFTIGSCFARSVEVALAARGFRIPVREVFGQPEFAQLEPGIINNYGTPSIYNELAWAFDEQHFEPEHHILEIKPGRFADLHFSPVLRPDSWDKALRRREAIRNVYREAARCRVIIITLGLSEVWFDTRTGAYLNVTPRPSMLRAEPDRFRLHVLTYEETLDYLERALSILRRHGRPDLQVLLTVSPVPLSSTHREVDVILANSYSKSVLRAAAEVATCRHEFVTYFPSYESVVLSDRRRAYIDDLVHVSDELIAFNVERMIRAFVPQGRSLQSLAAAIEAGGEATAVESARDVAREIAEAFFEAHADWSRRSISFAVQHARWLLSVGRSAEADIVLAPHAGARDLEFLAVHAQTALAAGDADEALKRLESLPDRGVQAVGVWDQMLAAAIARGDPASVISVATRYTRNVPNRIAFAYLQLARFFRDRGDRDRAVEFYAVSGGAASSNMIRFELAEALLVAGRTEDAAEIIANIEPNTPAEALALERLRLLAA